MTDSHAGDAAKTVLQVAAILAMTVIVAMILHKGSGDISDLAQKHSGGEFWKALLRYFLRNFGAGSSSGG